MISLKSTISKMDFMDSDSNLSLASWPLTSELEQFNALVLGTQGNDENVTTSQPIQNSQATLQSSEPWECQDLETYSAWQEEPMDLEVFAQSVDTWRLGIEFDESSSVVTSPRESAPTPIYPSSPIGLHLNQVEFTADKLKEQNNSGLVDGSVESFDSFVLSPSQFQPLDSIAAVPAIDAQQKDVAPEQSCQDDDDTLAILDELLQGVMEKNGIPSDMFTEFMEELKNEPINEESEQAMMINLIVDDISNHQTVSVPTEELNTSESDVEWKPEPTKRRKTSSTGRASRAQKKEFEVVQSPGRPIRQRKKDLPMEDRRLRKKEQNKTAATRYRQKKKAELEILQDEEASLAIRNKELKQKCEDLSKEVSYLKNLMREVLLAQKSKS